MTPQEKQTILQNFLKKAKKKPLSPPAPKVSHEPHEVKLGNGIKLIVPKGEKGEKGETPVKGKDYFTILEIKEIANAISSNIKDGKDGKDGVDGQDGYTPIKGIDYFDGETPVRGKDYWTFDDQKTIISNVLNKIPKPKDIVEPKIETIVSKTVDTIKSNKSYASKKEFADLVELLKRGGYRGGGMSSLTVDVTPIVGGLNNQVLYIKNGVIGAQDYNPSGVNFADNEVPSGTINGVNRIFTLNNSPGTSLHLYLNGLRITNMVDYTLSGFTITFINPPLPGDKLIADYRY